MSESKTIVFIVFQTSNRSNGGVESITQVIERLQGWNIHVITNLDTARTERWRKIGAEVVVYNKSFEGGKVKKALFLIGFGAFVKRYLRTNPAEIVHCNDIDALYYSSRILKKSDCKVVFNVRDIKEPHQNYGKKWHQALEVVDHVLLLSNEMKEQFSSRLKLDQERVSFIYSIVDSERIHPGLEPKYEVEQPHVGVVAAVMDKKQQLSLINEGLPTLIERIPNVRVTFVGDFDPDDDDYSRDCKKAVDNLNLNDSVEFVGFQSDVEVWYRSFDIGLVASKREGMARCMIESLAVGTPVVSFDVCSAREILEEQNAGLVSNQGDYEDLVSNTVTLLENKSTRDEMAERGVELSRKLFDPSTVAKSYTELYQSLL